jgi:hypothetical protein
LLVLLGCLFWLEEQVLDDAVLSLSFGLALIWKTLKIGNFLFELGEEKGAHLFLWKGR